MKNNQIPEVRFSEFKEAWKLSKFEDFTKLSQGLQIAISDRFLEPGKNREFYITNEFLNANSQKSFYIENPPKSVVATKKDILMTRTGNTGKVVTGVNGAFHNNFFKVSYNENKTDWMFLFYLLNSTYIQKEIMLRAGSSTIPDLSHKHFYSILVSKPENIKEQVKIGRFFAQMDDTITLHQQELTVLKQTKQGFLQKMFPKDGEKVPEVRLPGFTDDWEQRMLGECGEFKNGMNFDKNAMGHGNRFVNLQDVFGKNILEDLEGLGLAESSDKQKKDYNLIKGDVLFIRSSVKPSGVGSTALVPKDYPNTTYSGFIIRFRPNITFDNNFNRYLFGIKPIRNQIMAKASSSANTNINQEALANIKILLPSVEEQTKIGNFFKQLDDTIALHQRELEILKNTKKAFLQKMFV